MWRKMNKKAQYFTVLAIFLISLTFLSFELFSYFSNNASVQTRVNTMDNFLFSVEENLERQMFITGFRTIFLAETEITDTGNYIDDIDVFFQEAFFNGSVNGVNESILLGARYADLIDSLNDKARKINVNITLSNPVLEVSQEDPWNVKLTLTTDFIMNDTVGLALWKKQQIISAYIPVSGFEDPVFTINSFAKVSRKISKTPYEEIYVSGNDISNLLNHVNSGFYAENSDAPSFLKRLEGDLSADSNGIESFVRTPDFSAQGLPVLTKTTVDYIYFSGNDPVYYQVTGMPSWFYVDDENNHLDKYQVVGLTY